MSFKLSIGRTAVLGKPMYTNEAIAGFRLSETIDRTFLQNYLEGFDFRRSSDEAVKGSTLNKAKLRSLPVLLPPISEQHGIAAILDAIDAASERAEGVITAVEHVRSALLQRLLTRGMPGWHAEYKEVSGTGSIPADWDVVRLGEVAEVASGLVDPTNAMYDDHLFVAPDDLESRSGRLLRSRSVGEVGAISGKYLFTPKDVVYSKIRPYLMKVYLPEEDGLCSADMYPIRPSARLVREHLATVLLSKHCATYIATCSERTGIPKVNRPDLLRYQFGLPSVREQQAIAGALASLDGAIGESTTARLELEGLKRAASDTLLSGRVRVADAKGAGA